MLNFDDDVDANANANVKCEHIEIDYANLRCGLKLFKGLKYTSQVSIINFGISGYNLI